MALQTPTKTQIQNKFNSLVIANSDLTSVRAQGRLNAISSAQAAVLVDFYRDLQLGLYNDMIQGLFDLFSFSALPGSQASTNLSVVVSGPTTIPQGFTGSTVGNSTSPAILFESTSVVSATAAGTVSVPVNAVLPGSSGNVAAGTITNIISAVPNVISISNATATQGGSDPESLSAQTARFTNFLASLTKASNVAVAYAASQVSGVTLASAVGPYYLTGIQQNQSAYNDETQALNTPKGLPLSPFVTAPSINDAFYIGATGFFTGLYLDVSTAGSGLSTVWEYYTGSAWASLSLTIDQTSGGQQSGSVEWSMPTNWQATTINTNTKFYVRLRLTSTAFTTLPQWYGAFTNYPPPGFINLFYTQNASATNVAQNIQAAVESVRAAGDTVLIYAATQVVQNITMTVIPTALGVSQNLSALITSAMSQLFAGLQIGQSLSLSQIISAVTSLGGGDYVISVQLTTPSTDISVATSQLLTLGTVTVTIGSAGS